MTELCVNDSEGHCVLKAEYGDKFNCKFAEPDGVVHICTATEDDLEPVCTICEWNVAEKDEEYCSGCIKEGERLDALSDDERQKEYDDFKQKALNYLKKCNEKEEAKSK